MVVGENGIENNAQITKWRHFKAKRSKTQSHTRKSMVHGAVKSKHILIIKVF